MNSNVFLSFSSEILSSHLIYPIKHRIISCIVHIAEKTIAPASEENVLLL